MKKNNYIGGIIIVVIGLLFVFAAIGFDIKKYIAIIIPIRIFAAFDPT